MIALQTLGEVRLTGSDVSLSSRRKELTLLAFVARRGRACARRELASLLWEDRADSRGRQSLRQALTELKRAVGDALVVNPEDVRVDETRLALDTTAFDRALDSDRPDEAVALWHGDFLAGMDDVGGDAFHAWLEAERESLRRRLARALALLCDRAAEALDRPAELAWATRWADALPFDEAAHGRMIDGLVRAGRVAEATARWEAIVARIRVELGADPSPDLLAARPRPARTSKPARRPGSAALFSPDLAGRGPALAELAFAWESAAADGPVTLLVEGEAGMGKSRLLDEFVRRLREGGRPHVLFRGRGQRLAHRDEPLSGARELFAALPDAPGLAGADPAALAAVATLIPALQDRFPAASDRPTTPKPALGPALAEVLGSIADERPLLLVLDDVGLLDHATLGLLRVLLAPGPARTLVLATARDEEVTAVLDLFRDAGQFRRLKLQPLPPADVETMLASMLELTSSDRRQLATRLQLEGGGNPFYVTEMTSALVDEGRLVPTTEGGWRLAPGADGSLPLPSSLRDAVARRLDRLDPVLRSVLEAAAVLGHRFDPALLGDVLGGEPPELAARLDALVVARFLRHPAGATDALEFTHDFTARVAYEELGPARRRRYHAVAARAFAARDAGVPGARAAAAYHRARAGFRTRRVGVLVGALVAAFAGAALFWRPSTAADAGRQQILVAPFRNETGDSTLEPVGAMAADWITQGIAQSGLAQIVLPQTVRAATRRSAPGDAVGGAVGAERIRQLAVESGAGTIVSGAYYRAGDSLVFQTQISDARGGTVLGALPGVHGTSADPSAAIEELRQRVVGALALMLNARLSGMNQNPSYPPAYAAYEQFVAGLDLHLQYRYAEAIRRYRQALALDSTFRTPLVWAALATWSLDDFAACDSLLRQAEQSPERLTRYDALLAANQRGELTGDYLAALRAAEEMTRVATGSEAYILVGQEALKLNRPRQALAAFLHADPDRGWIKGWEGYWGFLAATRHALGEPEAALAAAQEARRRFPESIYGVTYEINELAGMGRMHDMDARITEVLSRPPVPSWPPALVLHQAALELRAHGWMTESIRLAERGLALVAARPDLAAPRYLPSLAFSLAYLAGRWPEAEGFAERLTADLPNDPIGPGALGLLAARRGDSTGARRWSAALAADRHPYTFGGPTIWRARIAAGLGEREEAIRLLRLAFSEGAKQGRALHTDPYFEALTGYPPFDALLRPGD